ncbi:hypothetical protein J2W48_003538 [Flavobacterium piscis]|uniref:Uncharacterized protein n=1 Tax=Flavobacterium piscis TaxID=1114874 RepID=A0ABU1YBG5_9FLAO|nr:hypothetical protein [Flavobacterium piscis]
MCMLLKYKFKISILAIDFAIITSLFNLKSANQQKYKTSLI